MNPISRLLDALEDGSFGASLRSCMEDASHKCRCCNDKMPIVSEKREERTLKNGAKTRIHIVEHGKRRSGLRRANVDQPQLDKAVEMLIRHLKDHPEVMGKSWYATRLTKEGVAAFFQAPEHQVQQSFQKMNREGLLHQPIHEAPHDSKRDFWGGNDSSWSGSTYKIR